jgi:hypothetical protein
MFRILVLLAILGGLGYCYWTTTPEFAMREVRNAVRQHDLTKFQKYVDTETLASGMVDDLLAKPMQDMCGPGVLGKWVVAGFVGFFKPDLVKTAKEQINHFVETGEFVRKESSDVDNKMSLGNIDHRFGFRKHAFKGIEYDHKDGKVALLGLQFHNEVYNKDLTLEVKMRDVGGYWRLAEITNFPTVSAKIIEWETSHAREQSDQSSLQKL